VEASVFVTVRPDPVLYNVFKQLLILGCAKLVCMSLSEHGPRL